jgi:hypothetical protein
VSRGHFDRDGVKRMLGKHPTLLNAEYDWEAGDFELAYAVSKDPHGFTLLHHVAVCHLL